MNGSKKNIKISVIVPIYNSVKFISKCLESILNQSIKEIEVILLNDGSTDDLEDVIKDYQQKDQRIQYYFHNNIGIALTRTKGISLAKGDYIAFVDSDDYMELNMLEKMYNKALCEKADVVLCETYIKGKDDIKHRKHFTNTKTINIKETGVNLFLHDYFFTNIYRNCVWDKLYKRKFIIENKLSFGDKNIFAEDLFFQFHLIINKPIITFINEPLYYYVQREDSLMHSVKESFMEKHLFLVNILYSNNAINSPEISMFIDCILFQGLLNETKTILLYKRGYNDYRETMAKFHVDASYEIFMNSIKVNKSYRLYEFKYKKYLFFMYYFLRHIHFRFIAEILLYVKQYISIKKNKS